MARREQCRCFFFISLISATAAAAAVSNFAGVDSSVPVLLDTLRCAIDAVSPLCVSFTASVAAVELPQRGAVEDCAALHAAAAAALSRAADFIIGHTGDINDVRTYLSAALTNRATCLDGLAGAGGAPAVEPLLSVVASAYQLVTDSLALATSYGATWHNDDGFWHDEEDEEDNTNGDNGAYAAVITVAKDGSGNYTTVSAAVAAAPNNSEVRTLIKVKAGVYEENVDIPSYKTNIVMLGDGRDVTVITARRSAGDGWTTFNSATVAVSGEGFLAQDIAFQNAAGADKGQAVALRVNANRVAVYRCAVDGHQDTLYAHSYRQFYRDCIISGTVDFIFGNAAAVFQACTILVKNPVTGQENTVTAHGRDDPNENTAISMQNCTVRAADDLAAGAKTYLGRPWGPYARTVVMESRVDGVVDRAGWVEWPGGSGLDKVYFGEYMNSGDGAATDGRVQWPGYHKMSYGDASAFSAAKLIAGDEWLRSTSVPYDSDV